MGVRGDWQSLPVRLLRRRFGEYRLMIEPVILGGRKRLFPDDGRAHALELVATTVSKTGVHICTYRPVRDTASSRLARTRSSRRP